MQRGLPAASDGPARSAAALHDVLHRFRGDENIVPGPRRSQRACTAHLNNYTPLAGELVPRPEYRGRDQYSRSRLYLPGTRSLLVRSPRRIAMTLVGVAAVLIPWDSPRPCSEPRDVSRMIRSLER